MDINRTSDALPSGYEVESASFIPQSEGHFAPCGCGMTHHHHHEDIQPSGGMKQKIDDLKSRALSTASTVKEQASVKMADLTQQANVKLADLKHQANVKLAETKEQWNLKVADTRVLVDRKMVEAKSNARMQAATMQTSMRTDPMKWAAIAGGSGLVLGLLGRFMQYRAKQRSRMPQLIIIEHAC
ncbi:MAG TPA: hypothetical protein VF618_15415 [Thermoanaerobaculia bacterium]